LDFGSGAGFPGIPIALIRPEISVTLAESQNKKAAFLREAVRTLALNTKVHAARAETLPAKFDAITLRAVDNMAQAIPAAIRLLNPNGWLAILTTIEDASEIQTQIAQSIPFFWRPIDLLPSSTQRVLLLGQHANIHSSLI
jgi:16S rRNA (guanine527-N7)-methyltransferase